MSFVSRQRNRKGHTYANTLEAFHPRAKGGDRPWARPGRTAEVHRAEDRDGPRLGVEGGQEEQDAGDRWG